MNEIKFEIVESIPHSNAGRHRLIEWEPILAAVRAGNNIAISIPTDLTSALFRQRAASVLRYYGVRFTTRVFEGKLYLGPKP